MGPPRASAGAEPVRREPARRRPSGAPRERASRKRPLEPETEGSVELAARWRRLGLSTEDLATADPSGSVDRWLKAGRAGVDRSIEEEVGGVIRRAERDPRLARLRVDRLLAELKARGRDANLEEIKSLEDQYFALRGRLERFGSDPDAFWNAARDLELRLAHDVR